MAEFADLFEKSKLLIDNARGTMGILVNSITVYTSFLLGKYMVEEEQQGAGRAKYGAKILDSLSSYLTEEYTSCICRIKTVAEKLRQWLEESGTPVSEQTR